MRSTGSATCNGASIGGLPERIARTVWSCGCTSWYLDRNGKNTTRRLHPERDEAIAATEQTAARAKREIAAARP